MNEDSTWQNGPEFLKWPVEEWPIKSAGEVAAHARESVQKLQRKAFSSALTRAQARSQPKEDLQATQKRPKGETQNQINQTNGTPKSEMLLWEMWSGWLIKTP